MHAMSAPSENARNGGTMALIEINYEEAARCYFQDGQVKSGRFTDDLSIASCWRSAKFSRANRRCDWNRERNVFSTASNRFSMPMMLQQTRRNFKDFHPIEFSEGTGAPCVEIAVLNIWQRAMPSTNLGRNAGSTMGLVQPLSGRQLETCNRQIAVLWQP